MSRQDAMHAKTAAKEPSPETDAIARTIIGAAIAVHRHLGPGYLEAIYEEALCVELSALQVEFDRQMPMPIVYRDAIVGEHRLDLLVARRVVVELKHVEKLGDIHRAQVISYLKAGPYQLGLLINFNVPLLKDGICRVIYSGE